MKVTRNTIFPKIKHELSASIQVLCAITQPSPGTTVGFSVGACEYGGTARRDRKVHSGTDASCQHVCCLRHVFRFLAGQAVCPATLQKLCPRLRADAVASASLGVTTPMLVWFDNVG